MLRCPDCQTLNPPLAKFCYACGLRLLICPYCKTANPPIARFCIECGQSLAEGERPDAGNPTASAGSPQKSQALEDPQAAALRSQESLPAQPRASVQTQPLAQPEERRVVTVIFADITGSTPLAEHLDPEDLRAILASYFNLMAEQIRRHGGTVEKYIGDAVMAVFGIPVAHEDDPDRAIRAALDMQLALESFNRQRRTHDPEAIPLQMRIGINTGEVATPDPGRLEGGRRDFLVTGDAVHIAARLQQVATPDTILVGERTYLATRGQFAFRPLAPLHLKGKPEPVRAWVVLGPLNEQAPISMPPRGIQGLAAPLIGRSLELTLMHATYARVQAERQPHLITLLGPPGIGKSRLVYEFIAREQEKVLRTTSQAQELAPLVMRGRCPPYGEGITYWPLIEILRSLLQLHYHDSDEEIHDRFSSFVSELLSGVGHREGAQEVAEAILRSIGRQLDSDVVQASAGSERRERQRVAHTRGLDQPGLQAVLLRSWRIFLEALAQRQPLILVIDDLQWADEALLNLLEHLMGRLSNVPILFLCPARLDFLERRQDWGGGQRNFTTIVLEALSEEESRELLKALLQNAELPEPLCRTILARAEGNPFFVEEIVRMLIDQGILLYEEGSWHVARHKEPTLGELASPAAPPDDTWLNLHYILPLPRLPDTIQGVLAARLDLLSPVEKHVLQQAAIIGRTFWLSGLRELTAEPGEAVLLQTLESLIQRDFIAESPRSERSPVEHDRVFSFKHILIRDVVYNTISRARRSQAHAHLAVWLEQQVAGRTDRFVELLAYHYQQAVINWPQGLVMGLQDGRQTLPVAAGMTASGLSGPPSAEKQLALEELRQRAIAYLTAAGDQALSSYCTIRAIQAYSEALELLMASHADNRALATMHEKLGDAFAQRSHVREAWQEYREALRLLKTEPQAERSDLLYLYDSLAELATRLGPWSAPKPDMQEIRAYIDAGLELAEDQGDRAVFLTYLAMWYMLAARRQEHSAEERRRLGALALQNGSEALRMAQEAGDLDALWLTLDALSAIYMKQHKYLEAHRTQHSRQELVEQINREKGRQDRQELHDLYYSLGWVHCFISDYPTAIKWFGESWRIAQTMESPLLLLVSTLGRMHVWYEWDRWADAYEVAQKVLQLVDQYQLEEAWEVDALQHLALISYRRGDQEQGERFLRRLKMLIEQIDDPLSHVELQLNIQLAREEWAAAFETLEHIREESEPFPLPENLALLAELAIRAGQPAERQRELCEYALNFTRQSGARKAEGMALRACGYRYMEEQDWEAALATLREALALFARLDLPWERGQTLYLLGELHRRRAALAAPTSAEAERGHELARRYFEQALGFFASLHAVRDSERARLALGGEGKAPL
jgi:class 3 adenylate cyclase